MKLLTFKSSNIESKGEGAAINENQLNL